MEVVMVVVGGSGGEGGGGGGSGGGGGGGDGGSGWGRREDVFHHTTLPPAERFCIKMCSGVSHFNASLIVRRKTTRDNVRKQSTTFEDKGEPKRTRSAVGLLSSLAPVTARPKCFTFTALKIKSLLLGLQSRKVTRRKVLTYCAN